jgi:hypothetical protein
MLLNNFWNKTSSKYRGVAFLITFPSFSTQNMIVSRQCISFYAPKPKESFSERFYMNGPRVHQNPCNLAIWFIIQYHKTRIFFCFGQKKKCRFGEFLKNFGFE